MGPLAATGEEAQAHPWVVAVGYRQFTASLKFEGDLGRELHQKAASMSFGRLIGAWMLRASAARIVDGNIAGGVKRATIQPGWTLGVAASRRFVIDDWPKLYIGGSISLAAQFASAGYGGTDTPTDLRAGDVRLGVTAGWMILDRIVPYALARAFGGPVSWRAVPDQDNVGGSDRHHFQVGAGLSAVLVPGLYASAEYVPLGERSASFELGTRF